MNPFNSSHRHWMSPLAIAGSELGAVLLPPPAIGAAIDGWVTNQGGGRSDLWDRIHTGLGKAPVGSARSFLRSRYQRGLSQ